MNLGYVVAAALSVIAASLLFAPWLTVIGPAGRLTVTGFGHVTGLTAAMASSVEVNSYVYVPTSSALTVGSVCAGLAAFSVCVTLLATLAYLRTRRDVFSFTATGSSVATVALMVGQLWNVNTATSQMRSLVAPSQGGSHATLSVVAVVAVIVAFAAALCASAARMHRPVPVGTAPRTRPAAPVGLPVTPTVARRRPAPTTIAAGSLPRRDRESVRV